MMKGALDQEQKLTEWIRNKDATECSLGRGKTRCKTCQRKCVECSRSRAFSSAARVQVGKQAGGVQTMSRFSSQRAGRGDSQ